MSKNMMQWTLGLLAVGCVLAMAAPAGAAMMDSADFTWKYEMNILPNLEDLDVPPNEVMDFDDIVGGGTCAISDPVGILEMRTSAADGRYYYNYKADQTWQLDPNISYENGFTYEVRFKITRSDGLGHAFAAFVEDLPGAYLNVTTTGQSWGAAGTSFGGTFDNTEFCVYRVAQAPNETKFSVWRNGQLLSDQLGAVDVCGDCIIFGDFGGTWGGDVDIDYVRFTGGAYAPIPEPGTLVLLAGALLSLLVWRRR